MIQTGSATAEAIRLVPLEGRARRTAGVSSSALAHASLAGVWVAGIAVLSLTTAEGLRARAMTLHQQAAAALHTVEESALTVHHLEAGYVTHQAWCQTVRAVDGIAARHRRPPLPLVINEVSCRRPDGVWLKRVAVQRGTLEVSGSALAEDAVTAYLDRLAASPYMNFVTMGALRRVGDSAEVRFEFRIIGRLATE